MKKDTLLRAVACGGEIAVTIVSARKLTEDAMRAHDLSPTPSAALGRTLIAALMMAEELKDGEDTLTVTISGGGSVGKLVALADGDCTVRGYAENPHAEAPQNALGKLNVSAIVGNNGTVTVARMSGGKSVYTGISEIVSGEIAEDISNYYAESEQKATAVALGVSVSPEGNCLSAGGVLLHLLPGVSEKSIAGAEQVVKKLGSVSSLLREKTAREALSELFPDAEVLAEKTPFFKCKCSRGSVRGMLSAMAEEDTRQLLKERGEIEVVCGYCGKKYIFSEL